MKASIDTKIKKIKNASINVKSVTIANESFFLYDNENVITETYVSELIKNISIHGLIAFSGKTNNKDNKLQLITPKHKLKYDYEKDTYKNKIDLKLG